MCFAPQRRAVFGFLFDDMALRTLRFSEPIWTLPSHKSLKKTQWFATSPHFAHLTLHFSSLSASSSLCFSSFHIWSEVWPLNFLRWYIYCFQFSYFVIYASYCIIVVITVLRCIRHAPSYTSDQQVMVMAHFSLSTGPMSFKPWHLGIKWCTVPSKGDLCRRRSLIDAERPHTQHCSFFLTLYYFGI